MFQSLPVPSVVELERAMKEDLKAEEEVEAEEAFVEEVCPFT